MSTSGPVLPPDLAAVTFDCWNTLLVPAPAAVVARIRTAAIAEVAGLDEMQAAAELAEVTRAARAAWEAGRVFGPDEMAAAIAARHSLAPESSRILAERLSASSRSAGVEVVGGAAELLAGLRARGYRLALISDVLFTSGAHVRVLLDEAGLLCHFAATVFSTETGRPKPAPVMFETALRHLGVPPRRAVHIGDLRAADVAGARNAGLAAIRFRGAHDDRCEGPEAIALLDRLTDLPALLPQVCGPCGPP